MATKKQAYQKAMTLAALSGFKIALGPAFLETSRRGPNARHWVIGALAEMVLDKVGVFPPRYRPSLLIPHTAAGAWVARESLRDDGIEDLGAVAMGAAVAAGVAIAAPLVRIGLHKVGVPDFLLGFAEDALAIQLGKEAVGLSMEEIAEEAQGAFGEVRERVKPSLQKVGIPV
jgi:hypothetical protein